MDQKKVHKLVLLLLDSVQTQKPCEKVSSGWKATTKAALWFLFDRKTREERLGVLPASILVIDAKKFIQMSFEEQQEHCSEVQSMVLLLDVFFSVYVQLKSCKSTLCDCQQVYKKVATLFSISEKQMLTGTKIQFCVNM